MVVEWLCEQGDGGSRRDTVQNAYSFGPSRLEVGERRLWRDGKLVAPAGKAFDTLRLLVEGAGMLQTQASLIDRLWWRLMRSAIGASSGSFAEISLPRRVTTRSAPRSAYTIARQPSYFTS